MLPSDGHEATPVCGKKSTGRLVNFSRGDTVSAPSTSRANITSSRVRIKGPSVRTWSSRYPPNQRITVSYRVDNEQGVGYAGEHPFCPFAEDPVFDMIAAEFGSYETSRL